MIIDDDFVIPESTVVVPGHQRVALINVHRQTLMRLTKRTWGKLVDNNRSHGELEKLTGRLIEDGYLEAPGRLTPSAATGAGTQCLTPAAKTLVISDEMVTNLQATQVVREYIEAGYTSHVIALHDHSKQPSREVREFVASLNIPYEIGYAVGGLLNTRIFSRAGHEVGIRKPTECASTRLRFQLALDYKSILINTKKHEGFGFIYVDRDGTVWPNWIESTINFGHLSEFGETSPGDSNQAFKEFSVNSKAKRDICMECELRAACVWSVSLRVEPCDIRSAPKGCSYDPGMEDFQSEKF